MIRTATKLKVNPKRKRRTAKAKAPSAARLAKAAISVFDNDFDSDVDAKDIRRLKAAAKRNPKAKVKSQRAKSNPGPSVPKKNADLLTLFAHGASGILSALQIREMLKQRKERKKRNPGKAVGSRESGVGSKKMNPTGKKQYVSVGPTCVCRHTKSEHEKTGQCARLNCYCQQFRSKRKANPVSKTAMAARMAKVRAGKKNPAKSKVKSQKVNPTRRVSTKKYAGSDDYYLMPFADGVYLSHGVTLGRRFATAAAARKYAREHRIKLNPAPAKAKAKSKVKSQKANPAPKKAVAKKANPEYINTFFKEKNIPYASWTITDKTGEANFIDNEIVIAFIKKTRGAERTKIAAMLRRIDFANGNVNHFLRHLAEGLVNQRRRNPAKAKLKVKSQKANPVVTSIAKKAPAKKANPQSAIRSPRSKRNPPTTARRRTFEMFQGRRVENARPMPVSRHAGASPRMDQLGDLFELKLANGQVIKLNPDKFKLCALRGRMWIVGGKFAKADAKQQKHTLNPIEYVDHVVYRTHKPHHGDPPAQLYIHKLGEVSGKWPLLTVDNEGFPVLKNGAYKIRPEGIVD